MTPELYHVLLKNVILFSPPHYSLSSWKQCRCVEHIKFFLTFCKSFLFIFPSRCTINVFNHTQTGLIALYMTGVVTPGDSISIIHLPSNLHDTHSTFSVSESENNDAVG